jgi:hypothetical protein
MELRLESGETVAATTFDGRTLTLQSPKAFAPGSPIRFQSVEADGPRSFEGRTLGSRRVDDTTFEVRLRLINLRRADREHLVAKIGS